MVKRWDDSVASALSGAKPTFVGAKNPDGEQVALSYGLVKSMSTSSKFNTLLEMLRKGANFNQALMQVYGSNAQGLAAAWLR
jgi:hypothetical protein